MKFLIQTGEYSWRVEAKDWKQAIKRAWKKNPPKHLGILTSVDDGKEPVYLNSIKALNIAGYEMES